MRQFAVRVFKKISFYDSCIAKLTKYLMMTLDFMIKSFKKIHIKKLLRSNVLDNGGGGGGGGSTSDFLGPYRGP